MHPKPKGGRVGGRNFSEDGKDEMGNLSKNFSSNEFACKCCDYSRMDTKLISGLQKIRDFFNSPVTVTSGARCMFYNKRIGGVANSAHVPNAITGRCHAADIVVAGVSPLDVCLVASGISAFSSAGLGLYVPYNDHDGAVGNRFVHLDTRPGGIRRWGYYYHTWTDDNGKFQKQKKKCSYFDAIKMSKEWENTATRTGGNGILNGWYI